ncbi:hypothetical protein [Longimicrobium sp.]|uniref:hypothetical protein n=1 Tax=Longimicrobium sp. TaxID=2029185 RepID=UPI002CBD7125|nr:hypothetical protein [Longimicrobium sp.]HSU14170.1 hypothetical protein [Longimicrobium sp.]
MKRTRLDLSNLRVQSFATSAVLSDDEAQADHDSYRQCISELSACGVCPTDTFASPA